MADTWEPAAQVAKNDAGKFVALIGGKWEPVASASKNDAGQFLVLRGPTQTRPKTPIETPAFEKEAAQIAEGGLGEFIASDPVTRLALGVASPVLGLAQLGANAIGKGDGINAHLRELEAMKDRGNLTRGSGAIARGVGAGAELAGNVGSTLALPAMRAAPAAGVMGRMGQGATLGATQALATPVTGEGDFLPQKTGQVMTGAVLGGVMPPVIDAAKFLGAGVRNSVQPYLGQSGLDKSTGRALNLVAGDKKDDVVEALLTNRSAVPGVNYTAGQAAVPSGSTEFAAFQKLAADRAGSLYSDVGGIGGQQEAARRAAIDRISKGVVEQEAAKAAREVTTKPMREVALKNANLANETLGALEQRAAAREASRVQALQDQGRFQTAAAQQENLAVGGTIRRAPVQPENAPQMNVGATGGVSRNTDVTGVSTGTKPVYIENAKRVPEAASAADDAGKIVTQRAAERDFAKMQADSLAQSGNFPLKSDSILRQLDRITKDPAMGASDVVEKTMTKLKEKIAGLTGEGGTIDAKALYTVRKEIGDAITVNAKELGTSDKRMTAGLQMQIQKQIDDAIEGAGNAGWKDYLKKYAEMSKPINEMKLGDKLKDALTSSAGGAERDTVFANAVRDAGNKLGKASNRPIIDDMTPKNRAVVDAIIGDLKTNRQMDTMAREGMAMARERSGQMVPNIRPTGMFNPLISVARGMVNRLEGRTTNKLMDHAAKIMANPEETARIMKLATPAEQKVLNAMIQASQRAAVAGAVDQF